MPLEGKTKDNTDILRKIETGPIFLDIELGEFHGGIEL